MEFQFQHQSSNEHPGLISFRMDWLDLLAVQGTLKSLCQHHSSKATILWCSAFFIVQLSHPYKTTGKNTALTRWTFVDKVMSLLFNMLSRLVNFTNINIKSDLLLFLGASPPWRPANSFTGPGGKALGGREAPEQSCPLTLPCLW